MHDFNFEKCSPFLEQQIIECEDIELKKLYLQSYNELLKLKSYFDKSFADAYVRHHEINAGLDGDIHKNNTQQNIAYNQQWHETNRHNYAQQANMYNNAVNNPHALQIIPTLSQSY